jgi:hypothetical protein
MAVVAYGFSYVLHVAGHPSLPASEHGIQDREQLLQPRFNTLPVYC